LAIKLVYISSPLLLHSSIAIIQLTHIFGGGGGGGSGD